MREYLQQLARAINEVSESTMSYETKSLLLDLGMKEIEDLKNDARLFSMESEEPGAHDLRRAS